MEDIGSLSCFSLRLSMLSAAREGREEVEEGSFYRCKPGSLLSRAKR